MTDFTAEQIEAAARLVPGLAYDGKYYNKGTCDDWQPWADTEAGSADWAVLDTAVWSWLERDACTDEELALQRDMHAALASGDLKKRKAATFAAAAAIGEYMAHSGER